MLAEYHPGTIKITRCLDPLALLHQLVGLTDKGLWVRPAIIYLFDVDAVLPDEVQKLVLRDAGATGEEVIHAHPLHLFLLRAEIGQRCAGLGRLHRRGLLQVQHGLFSRAVEAKRAYFRRIRPQGRSLVVANTAPRQTRRKHRACASGCPEQQPWR